MDTYILEVKKYIGIEAGSVDEALYKYHEGYADLETESEVISVTKDNDFFDTGNDNEHETEEIEE